jgi:hypothetical protein
MPRQKRKNPAVWEEGSDVELEMPGPAQENQADRPFPPTVTRLWKTYHAEMETFKEQHAILEKQKEKQKKKDRKRRREERAAEREKKMAAEVAERNAIREAAKIERKKKKDEEDAAKEERKAARAAKAAANKAEKEAKRQARAAKAAAKAAKDNDEDEDDQQDEEDDEAVSETDDERPAPVKRAPIRRPAKRRKTGPFINDSETETEAELIRPARLPAFLRLPLEIREQIYIYLLAPDTDSRLRVQVCNGWTEPLLGRAHRQLRSQLHPAIMRVNSQIADECIQVLYGRNEFEYCLRDPSTESAEAQEEEEAAEAAEETVDVDDADADFEGTEDESETESDNEYEEPEPRRKTRIARRQPASQPAAAVTRAAAAPYDAFDPSVRINVRKFGHHYRRIRIRAEPGRSSPAYRTAMAQAIRVFTALEPRRARLHTLTLEITPQRDPDDENHVSFIDFFDPRGEVISAMRLLPCQFIRVLVHTELPSPETGLCETEIILDLRHAASMRRARRGERDVWQGDCVAMEVRQRKATMEQRRMLSLQKLIMHQWEKQELWVDELGRPITREQYEVELAEADDDWFWD